MIIDLLKIKEYSQKAYDDANCIYDNQNYFVHILMVLNVLGLHSQIFKNYNDYYVTEGAVYTHDLQEDAKQTYNNIKDIAGKDVADIVLAVTDVPAENRLMKHLLTMGKTVKDYRAIILKMCDIYANAKYSKEHGSSMYEKYVKEYQYRKPIFQQALTWYIEKINQTELNKFWLELDEIHAIL